MSREVKAVDELGAFERDGRRLDTVVPSELSPEGMKGDDAEQVEESLGDSMARVRAGETEVLAMHRSFQAKGHLNQTAQDV